MESDEDRYAAAATGWATGAARVYGPLATQLVAAAPHPLAGRRVLDAGAGTGLASTALTAVGAPPVAVDRSPAMLAWDAGHRPPAVAGALEALPLRDDAVDDAVAAFVLNHVDDPTAALAELARVTRPGGAVLATVAAATTRHRAVRDRIDAVVADAGFVPPPWYAHLTQAQAPLLGDVPAMTSAAESAAARRRRRHRTRRRRRRRPPRGPRRLPPGPGARRRVARRTPRGRPCGAARGGRRRRHPGDGALPPAGGHPRGPHGLTARPPVRARTGRAA